jgi:prevent-host-death family protein
VKLWQTEPRRRGDDRDFLLCPAIRLVRFGKALRAGCHKTEFGLYSVLNSRGARMKYSTRIKPISYMKANAAEIIRDLANQREPLVITQNGEAKAVMQDVATYEETQETMALLKILALGNRQIEDGKVVPAALAIKRLRSKKARG